MKILWFTNTPSLYDQGKHSYHGGGWIESLELLVKKQKEIRLAVSFFHSTDSKKVNKNNVTYYPLNFKTGKQNPVKTILNNWRGKIETDDYSTEFLKVIKSFRPDVIQVFGTEGPFAQVQELTNIPVVIHIQGIINPYLNTYYPVNQSKWTFLFNKKYFFKNLIANSPAFGTKRFKVQAEREKSFLGNAKYVMGRTHWDKMLTELYNPSVQYFHLDEVLRPIFYQIEAGPRKKNDKQPFKIISTLSPTVYKGIDVVLKTAKLLKELSKFHFQWEIIGLEDNAILLEHFEKTEGINHKKVNIVCKGRKSPEEMIELMKNADVFVHPSYIDNSPNSICEAQIIGLPVIACNVGGIATLIEHLKTGVLVPSNGVFEFAHYLCLLKNNENLRSIIGQQGKKVALDRHNRNKIAEELFRVYLKLNE